MPKARYYKTLFIPSLEGQHVIWENVYSKYAFKTDRTVQLGNLVGCTDRAKDKKDSGPNQTMLRLILLWRSTYEHWEQLVGPNEIMALNFPDEWTNDESNRILRARWFTDEHEGRFKVATVEKNRLVTHGGLTHGLWRRLGSPTDPYEAADAVNEEYEKSLYQGRCWRLNDVPNFSANPIFADPVREVYPSWVTADEEMPFSQVHAAPGLNTAAGRAALTETFNPLTCLDHIRYTDFGSVIEFGERWFFNVHPEFRPEILHRKLPSVWKPYVEKTPVVDLRDHLFEGDDMETDSSIDSDARTDD